MNENARKEKSIKHGASYTILILVIQKPLNT
jgi:hypothetical protein